MVSRFLCFILGVGLSCACCSKGSNSDKKVVDAHIVLKELQYIKSIQYTNCLDSIHFIECEKFLIDSIKLSYSYAINRINQELKIIDNINTNRNTKLYLKSLLFADFVYSAFSFQFFGDQLGKAQDFESQQLWNTLNVKQQYELGVSNTLSLDCGLRTKFFMKLVKNYLKIPIRDTSIESVHTYPIVTIGNHEYIVDPSDPIIFFNDSNSRVLNYKELKSTNKKINFRRFTRVFGTTNLLLSRNLLKEFLPLGIMFKNQLINYLDVIGPEISGKISNCFQPKFEKQIYVYKLNNPNNALAISSNARYLGYTLTQQSFKNNYFGVVCDL